MPAGPLKKFTCTMSSPLSPVYISSWNLPRKKFSVPLPSGCVELPTTIRAARSTRGDDINAGAVAATPTMLVATPTAATLIAIFCTRFVPVLAMLDVLPKVRVAT